MAVRQLVNIMHVTNLKFTPSVFIYSKSPKFITKNSNVVQFLNLAQFSIKTYPNIPVSKASSTDKITASDDNEEGINLGTMKLPANTDLARFETLLFQWGNSLCQGANLPLPVPLKVDKIPGGARLGFITVGDGRTEVFVYIDCLVFAASDNNPTPMFRAIRNGPMKDQSPPGEPRIMRSLLDALQKCVEIARI